MRQSRRKPGVIMLYRPEYKRRSAVDTVYDWLLTVAVSVIAAAMVISFVLCIAVVDGPSMLDTLESGNVLAVLRNSHEPQPGDIVIISRNFENGMFFEEQHEGQNEMIVKRVIAVAGQTVDIDTESGTVYVDGVPLDEPYIKDPTTVNFGTEYPLYVREGTVFVMGDNRLISKDSRSSDVGLIDCRYIIGRAVFRLVPFGGIYADE